MTPKEALDKIAILSEILVDVSKSHIMPNEAINEIRNLYVAEIYFTLRPALTELEELKKRDTPMKWIDVVDETGHYDKCPVCGYPSYNDLGHNHFCTVCGQRLEFEEVGDEK